MVHLRESMPISIEKIQLSTENNRQMTLRLFFSCAPYKRHTKEETTTLVLPPSFQTLYPFIYKLNKIPRGDSSFYNTNTHKYTRHMIRSRNATGQVTKGRHMVRSRVCLWMEKPNQVLVLKSCRQKTCRSLYNRVDHCPDRDTTRTN